MDRTELETKTKPQLIAMAAAIGLVLTPAASKGDMIDQLLGLPVTDVAAAQAEGQMPREGFLSSLDEGPIVSKGKVRVTIMATEDDKSDVFLRLNGHAIKVQRGVEVLIPVEYLGVLKDSMIYTVHRDPETGRVTPVQVMRVPFTAMPA